MAHPATSATESRSLEVFLTASVPEDLPTSSDGLSICISGFKGKSL